MKTQQVLVAMAVLGGVLCGTASGDRVLSTQVVTLQWDGTNAADWQVNWADGSVGIVKRGDAGLPDAMQLYSSPIYRDVVLVRFPVTAAVQPIKDAAAAAGGWTTIDAASFRHTGNWWYDWGLPTWGLKEIGRGWDYQTLTYADYFSGIRADLPAATVLGTWQWPNDTRSLYTVDADVLPTFQAHTLDEITARGWCLYNANLTGGQGAGIREPDNDAIRLQVTVTTWIPEPATGIVLGLAGLLALRRRR